MSLPTDLVDAPLASTRRPVVSLWLLRFVLLLHLALALSQPLTIGSYLDGVFSMVQVHGVLGSMLFLITMVAVVVAIGYAIAGGRVWVVPVLGLITFIEMIQVGMGYARMLGIHVPLGVATVVAAVLVAWWSWTPGARQGRPRQVRSRTARVRKGTRA